MRSNLQGLFSKLKAYIQQNPDRDPNQDTVIEAALVVGAFLITFGLAALVQNVMGYNQIEGDGSGQVLSETVVNTDPLARLETTTTGADMAVPTGEGEGPPTTAVDSTIAMASELPEEATSEAFAELGPAVPAVASPVGGASLRSLAPLLKWSKTSGATAYYIEISRKPDVSGDGYYVDPVASDQLVSGSSWRPPAIAQSGSYYWHVGVGKKGQYKPRFSASHRISITAYPGVNSPGAGTSVGQNALKLSWDELDGADSYQIEIATSTKGGDVRGFEDFVLRESYIKATSFVPPRPLRPGTYYWHVRGIDKDSARGDFSPPVKFRVTD